MIDARAIQESAEFIRSKVKVAPKIGLILGSGLGVLADEIAEPVKIPYGEIPHFPVSTVEGHAGKFVFGTLEGVPVCAMQGRFHFYEGYPMAKVTFPVRVMKAAGAAKLVVTNAAGGVNREFKPGDLMLITDHLNMMGTNPLIGPNDPKAGPRFPDMSRAYSRELTAQAREAAEGLGIALREGVYCAFTGPTYETPAEVRMARALGADAVGMSTVPEVIVARHVGLECLGISCITNMASGILDQPLSHEEVIETTERVRATFLKLVKAVVARIGK